MADQPDRVYPAQRDFRRSSRGGRFPRESVGGGPAHLVDACVAAGEPLRLRLSIMGVVDAQNSLLALAIDLVGRFAPEFRPPSPESPQSAFRYERRPGGEISLTTTTRTGSDDEGFELIETALGLPGTDRPSSNQVVVRAYGLPAGLSLVLASQPSASSVEALLVVRGPVTALLAMAAHAVYELGGVPSG